MDVLAVGQFDSRKKALALITEEVARPSPVKEAAEEVTAAQQHRPYLTLVGRTCRSALS